MRDSPNLDRMLNMPSWSVRRSDANLKDTGDKTPGVTPCDSQLANALRELFESALPVGVGVLLVRSALRTILPSATAPVRLLSGCC